MCPRRQDLYWGKRGLYHISGAGTGTVMDCNRSVGLQLGHYSGLRRISRTGIWTVVDFLISRTGTRTVEGYVILVGLVLGQ